MSLLYFQWRAELAAMQNLEHWHVGKSGVPIFLFAKMACENNTSVFLLSHLRVHTLVIHTPHTHMIFTSVQVAMFESGERDRTEVMLA